MNGIDCATPITAKTAAAIKANGYGFVGRYLVPAKGSLKWKALTKDEAKVISNAGLKLLTVYETTADRAKGGAVYGAYDGASAKACAEALNMPTDGVIYFAVDYDCSDYNAVEAYLKAARAATGAYDIGVYGSYRIVEAMYMRGVVRHFWQCVAWSYGKISAHYDVYQHTAGVAVAGISVDLNRCPDMDKAGMWSYGEDEFVERFNKISEMPKYAQDTIAQLCDAGIIKGYGTAKDEYGRPADLNMTEEQIRTLMWCKRMIEGVK